VRLVHRLRQSPSDPTRVGQRAEQDIGRAGEGGCEVPQKK